MGRESEHGYFKKASQTIVKTQPSFRTTPMGNVDLGLRALTRG
jgi:hypothetical protein